MIRIGFHQLARDKRITPRNDLFADRRPEHYRLGGGGSGDGGTGFISPHPKSSA